MRGTRERSAFRTLLGAALLAAVVAPRAAHGQTADHAASHVAAPTAAERGPAGVLPDTGAIPAPMIDRGRALFHSQGQCLLCHGPELEGTPVAPTLRAHAWRDAHGGSLEEIFRVITHGVPNTAMVSHPGGVSDESAAQLAAYVWSVSHGRAKP